MNLHEELDRTFAAITPTPPPIDEAIRMGMRFRWRRRVVAATGIVAVAAAAILISISIGQQAAPAPSTGDGAYSVTVQPPGPHSPAGEIAQGTVNGDGWQLAAEKPSRLDGQPRQCFRMSGVFDDLSACDPLGTEGTPVTFSSVTSADGLSLLWGQVESGVSSVTVALTSGQVLTLRPVTVYGSRWIAAAVPGQAIRMVTAYSAQGEIARAVPFDSAYGYSFTAWLKPGQSGAARETKLVGSGTTGGVHWSETVHAGPWGICVTTSDGQANCSSTMHAEPDFAGVTAYISPGNHVTAGVAGMDVARLVVRLPDGGTQTIRLVTVDGTKYWAFGYRGSLPWTAYDAAGQAVAHGTT